MATLNQFANRMNEYGRRVEANAPAIARRVALAVDQVLVLATPVDKGRARSNWQVRIGAPTEGVREAFSPGEKGSTGAANAQAQIAHAQAVVASYPGGSSIHITNNLPYIQRLNDGWSAQAPAGFVEASVQAGVRAVQNSKILDENGGGS